MTDRSPEFDAWIEKARAADVMAVASKLGVTVKRFNRDWKGACPVCSQRKKGSDRFVLTPSQPDPGKRWMCRGAEGGDPIAMVRHVNGCDFIEACRFITGEDPPDRAAPSRTVDPAVAKERREERADNRIDAAQDEKRRVENRILSARDVWDAARDIFGTRGERYFKRRGIDLNDEIAVDLRFIEGLDYFGFVDEEADEKVRLGAFPCVVAAMRDVTGAITAVHRTYLDARDPKKLVPPGDPYRNAAKQALGKAGRAMIRLGFITPLIAIGEGIETTLSFRALGGGGDECSFASAYSLGNLAGAAVAQLPHPTQAGRFIPNGEPNMDWPGIILPDEVREVILLGDGDSDPAATRATLLTAGRRLRAQGRIVSVSMAPAGADWNNVLTERMEIAA